MEEQKPNRRIVPRKCLKCHGVTVNAKRVCTLCLRKESREDVRASREELLRKRGVIL